MSARASIASTVGSKLLSLSDWWFDTARSVRTGPDAVEHRATDGVGERRDANIYLPARTSNVRRALRSLRLRKVSEYTFLDIGSGRGRALFIAAEYPFARVIGVEYSAHLHADATANIARFKTPRKGSPPIESVRANAADYEFPSGNLVIFLFNPFGPEIMARMLANLGRSVEREPRHVVLILLWPEISSFMETHPLLRVLSKERRHHVYEIVQPSGIEST